MPLVVFYGISSVENTLVFNKLVYFMIADEEKLEPSISRNNKKNRAFIAAYISGVRLIDNIKLY